MDVLLQHPKKLRVVLFRKFERIHLDTIKPTAT